MWLRRALWTLLGVAVIAGVLGLRAHTQQEPQCDPGFACANVDHLTWTGTDRDAGGLCVRMTLAADMTTMFRQAQWAGFRRAASQSSTLQPTAMSLRVRKACTDQDPTPALFTEGWISYAVAPDAQALEKARSEATRTLADPTRPTLVRGRDANWLYTVAQIPADTGTLDDAFGSDMVLAVPKHWSQELGELRLPCLWVAVDGSLVVGDQSAPMRLTPASAPVKVCAPGRGSAWFDRLDGFFGD